LIAFKHQLQLIFASGLIIIEQRIDPIGVIGSRVFDVKKGAEAPWFIASYL